MKAEPLPVPPPPRIFKITEWWNSKTRDNRRMFRVDPGESITFSVKVQEAREYAWEVNKRTMQMGTKNSFQFTVPDEKNIWEIHLTAISEKGEGHQELVVTNIPKGEAPELFEYFCDGKYAGPREPDPWGRRSREWIVERGWRPPETVRMWMEPLFYGGYNTLMERELRGLDGRGNFALRTVSSVAFGTWRLYFCFPMGYFIPPNGGSGPRTQLYYEFIGTRRHAFRYNKVSDTHNYFYERYYPKGFWIQLGNEDSGFRQRKGWYRLDIIRTKDGWFYTYITDIERGQTYLQFRGYDPDGSVSEYVRMSLDQPLWDLFPTVTLYVDGLVIYKDKYLFPPRSASFRKYVENWRWEKEPLYEPADNYLQKDWEGFELPRVHWMHIALINRRMPGYEVSEKRVREWKGRELRWMRSRTHFHPVYVDGIVIEGRGVTLEDVANSINDPQKLRYDPEKREFTCYEDLVIDEGAELIIRDCTLKMHCSRPGERKIAVMYGSTLRIINSAITTDNANYFLWRFVGASNFGYNLGMSTGVLNALSYGWFGSLFIEKSMIDDSAYFFVDSPREFVLRDVKFTRLHSVDAGEYSAPPSGEVRARKEFVRGRRAFCLFIKNYDIFNFEMDGVSFSLAEDGTPITFMLNTQKNRFNIYNCDFGNGIVEARRSVKMMSFWNSRWPEYFPREIGLVNCRFKKLRTPDPTTAIAPKYYLDVLVVDANGKPVKGAKVSVVNAVDNQKYPAENARAERPMGPMPNPNGERKNFHNYLMGFPAGVVLAGEDGHTPLPSDPDHTLILADYVESFFGNLEKKALESALKEAGLEPKSQSRGQKDFTHSIIVEKDGVKRVVERINPDDSWYRADPMKREKTIKIFMEWSGD